MDYAISQLKMSLINLNADIEKDKLWIEEKPESTIGKTDLVKHEKQRDEVISALAKLEVWDKNFNNELSTNRSRKSRIPGGQIKWKLQ
jgi:hypothetical protein